MLEVPFLHQLDLISFGVGGGSRPFHRELHCSWNLAGMFIISETEKELALSLLASELSSLQMIIHKAFPARPRMKLRAGVEPKLLFPSGARQVWTRHLESSQMETWSKGSKCHMSNNLIG